MRVLILGVQVGYVGKKIEERKCRCPLFPTIHSWVTILMIRWLGFEEPSTGYYDIP